MIASGPILIFEVGIELYLWAQHDWIFENGGTAFLVAKFDQKDLSVSEPFEELLSWNLESKLITPKYITGTYFGAIVAIYNFCFSVCFLCVMFFLTTERAPKAGPCHLFLIKLKLNLSIVVIKNYILFFFSEHTVIFCWNSTLFL